MNLPEKKQRWVSHAEVLPQPAGAGVTVNGVVGTVSDRYEGDYVSLRVSNDEANELVSMAVDTVTDYVQGSVKSFTYAKDQNDITLTNLSTGKSKIGRASCRERV